MALNAKATIVAVPILALAMTTSLAVLGAPDDEHAGPVLVLPSPAFGNQFLPAEVASEAASGRAEAQAEGPEEVKPAAHAAESNGAKASDAETAAPAEPDENEDADEPPQAGESQQPRRELSPAMATLRDQVRRTLAAYQGQPLNTAENTVTEVIYACRAFGCDTQVIEAATLRTKLNGITCLAWNYPCAGFTPLTISDGHFAARVGYGYQESPGELIAALALARVPADYPARVGDEVRTVGDLVEYEKLACLEDTDKALSMIGLMYYAGRGPAWRNRLGEEWSIERILKEELAKPVVGAPWGGTQRLMGLSYVVWRRAKRNQPLDGQYRRALDYLERFQDHALALQNENGSWSPNYLAAKGTSRDPAAVLSATGRILEWLAFSLPEERLVEPGMVRSVHFVNQMLSSGRYTPANIRSLRTEEIGAVMHSLAALRYYDARYFQPADPPPSR